MGLSGKTVWLWRLSMEGCGCGCGWAVVRVLQRNLKEVLSWRILKCKNDKGRQFLASKFPSKLD